MNYFEWFDIVPAFELDLSDLKRRYFLKSREVHPDVSSVDDALDLSSLNNEAYKTLNDSLSRIRYIVDSYAPGGFNEELPGDFLFEMMDFNEKLEDVLIAKDTVSLSQLGDEVSELKKNAKTDVSSIFLRRIGDLSAGDWKNISGYLSKQKYFERIRAKIEA